jgi:hypothetical protein
MIPSISKLCVEPMLLAYSNHLRPDGSRFFTTFSSSIYRNEKRILHNFGFLGQFLQYSIDQIST